MNSLIYFFLIFGFFPLFATWLSDNAYSLSQNCHGEGCTGDGCIGNYCTGKGCIGERCSGDGCKGDYCAGDRCKGASCGALVNDPGTGSDPGSGTGSDPGSGTDKITKYFPILKGQNSDCSTYCVSCGENPTARCEANKNALNYKIGLRSNNSQYAVDYSKAEGTEFNSPFHNFSKRVDLSIRTKYIVITYSGNYGEVYNDLYKDDSSLGSFSIKNGTKVIWINLDEHHSHTMNLFGNNYKNLLLTTMIPFGGTAEYTFKSVGQYQFFDPQNRVSTGTIVVN